MEYYVYVLANVTNVAIYVGVTNNLVRRVSEHKTHLTPQSYTAKYDVTKLVYFEHTSSVNAAISREKQLKSWSRSRKNELIAAQNPMWNDLYSTLL